MISKDFIVKYAKIFSKHRKNFLHKHSLPLGAIHKRRPRKIAKNLTPSSLSEKVSALAHPLVRADTP